MMLFPADLPQPIRIVFFDLDLTLLRTHSGLKLLRRAVQQKLVSRRAYWRLYLLGLCHRIGFLPADRLMRLVLKLLTGTAAEEFRRFTEEIIPEIILDIRPEAAAWLEDCRRKGIQTGILSAAAAEICRPVAGYLKMDFCLSTVLDTRQGLLTGDSLGPVCYGMEKWHCLQRWIREQGIDPGIVCYVADSWSDRFVMLHTGYAVCLNPTGRMRKLARRKNWFMLNLPE
jgi:HAD superfamily phosphoserine phosphatase-like hydrolase